jgi:hypothetical protein
MNFEKNYPEDRGQVTALGDLGHIIGELIFLDDEKVFFVRLKPSLTLWTSLCALFPRRARRIRFSRGDSRFPSFGFSPSDAFVHRSGS